MTSPDLAGAAWRKSSYTEGANNCVEVAANLPGIRAIRDSKNPHGPALTFEPTAFAKFIHSVKTEH